MEPQHSGFRVSKIGRKWVSLVVIAAARQNVEASFHQEFMFGTNPAGPSASIQGTLGSGDSSAPYMRYTSHTSSALKKGGDETVEIQWEYRPRCPIPIDLSRKPVRTDPTMNRSCRYGWRWPGSQVHQTREHSDLEQGLPFRCQPEIVSVRA